jgi:ABC-type nitrate/sulfonate/bicarbonate transport system substrate-binding protein
MNATFRSITSSRLTRRAMLGRMLALPLLPALSTLAACTPNGQSGAPSAGTPSADAANPPRSDSPNTSSAPKGGLKTLEVATVYAYLGYLPLYAAIQRGHLRERGLNLEIREFKAGVADVLIGSYDHVLKLREQGMDVVATGNVEAMYAYALMAKKGSPHTALDALAGQKLGTTGPGSSTDINLRYGLKQRGIDPDRGVELISVGGGVPGRPRLPKPRIPAPLRRAAPRLAEGERGKHSRLPGGAGDRRSGAPGRPDGGAGRRPRQVHGH